MGDLGKPREGELSRRERQLLDALYRLGKASAAEIREAVEDPPTYTAVRTHLTNMEAKGFVKFESDGTRYIYEPAVPREEMAEAVMSNVMETFFDNRLELIVSTLISRKEAKVSQEELDRLAEIIEKAREEGR
jgi:predicted transcriptional regulator